EGAFDKLRHQGDLRLLEPIMRLRLECSDDDIGAMVADLNARRGLIDGSDTGPSGQVVHALVPLANLFGFTNAIAALAPLGGVGFTLKFDHYREVPSSPAAPFPGAMALRA